MFRTLALRVALLVHLPLALAWDKDGHEAIGMTIMSALQNEPVAHVKRLMHGKDAVDVAAWAHKVNKKYPWTTELHFQRQPSLKCNEPIDLSKCQGNKCLIGALKYFYGRLVHQNLAEIEWPNGIKLTDADCVKYLINLVGDMHQPLHLGLDEGNMGHNITVLFRGKRVSLYDLWDKEMTQAVIKDSPGFWWGGWTHVQRTQGEFEKDSARWKQEGVKMFEIWAEETKKYACQDIYRNPITGKSIEEETEHHGGLFRVDEQLFETWKRELLNKILVAGARTAIVLNSILQHREAKELHDGTGVTAVEEDDDDNSKATPVGRKSDIPKGGPPVTGVAAFGVNLVIFIVVFVLFLYIMNLWTGKPSAVIAADREKQADSGKTF